MRILKRILIILFLSFSSLVVHPANVSILPYGINVHQVDNDVLQKVVDAGIKWIRTGANWSAVEIRKGTFDWTQVDRVVNYADSHDLSILFVIAYTPGWANRNIGFNYPPDNVSDWENFVRITVNRYKTKVKYWNIWNEPNSLDFFTGGSCYPQCRPWCIYCRPGTGPPYQPQCRMVLLDEIYPYPMQRLY